MNFISFHYCLHIKCLCIIIFMYMYAKEIWKCKIFVRGFIKPCTFVLSHGYVTIHAYTCCFFLFLSMSYIDVFIYAFDDSIFFLRFIPNLPYMCIAESEQQKFLFHEHVIACAFAMSYAFHGLINSENRLFFFCL